MKTWAWILVGGGAFTMIAGYLASRAKAQPGSGSVTMTSTTKVGGFTVPAGATLSQADLAVLAAIPADPATPGRVHHDLQDVLDYYLANRAADGSVTVNGTRYANLAAILATGGG
jgi:hypothetical protein